MGECKTIVSQDAAFGDQVSCQPFGSFRSVRNEETSRWICNGNYTRWFITRDPRKPHVRKWSLLQRSASYRGVPTAVKCPLQVRLSPQAEYLPVALQLLRTVGVPISASAPRGTRIVTANRSGQTYGCALYSRRISTTLHLKIAKAQILDIYQNRISSVSWLRRDVTLFTRLRTRDLEKDLERLPNPYSLMISCHLQIHTTLITSAVETVSSNTLKLSKFKIPSYTFVCKTETRNVKIVTKAGTRTISFWCDGWTSGCTLYNLWSWAPAWGGRQVVTISFIRNFKLSRRWRYKSRSSGLWRRVLLW
jgi:hypothetical protein